MADSDKKAENFNMRVSRSFMDQVDEWRRHQLDIPPRAEAIRRLVDRGSMFTGLVGGITILLDVLQRVEASGALSEEDQKIVETAGCILANAKARAAGLDEPYPMVEEVSKEEMERYRKR